MQENNNNNYHISYNAVRGLFWAYISRSSSKILVFVSIIILARVLLPSDFGKVAIALVTIGYLDTIGDFGVGAALIYEQKFKELASNITFFISIIGGILCFVIIQLTAPTIALFFKDPEIVSILRVLAWVFPITALGNTHDKLLQRDLAFKQRLIPEFARAFVKGILSIVLALLGLGVWSLVWGQLIGAFVATFVLWFVVPWRPELKFPRPLVRRMLRYGSHIVCVNILSALNHSIDFLIVGRMLGSAALGYYTMGFRVPEFVISMINRIVNRVAFPVYSKLQDDRIALQKAFLLTLKYVSILTIPAGCGLAFLAPTIVPTLFGSNWESSVPVVQGLALSITLRSLGSNAGNVYKATGRPQILTKLGLVRVAILVPALIFGTQFGIAGVAFAHMSVTGLGALLNLIIAARVLLIPMKSILVQFRPSILSSVPMVISLHILLPILSGFASIISLIISVIIGFGVYALFIWLISPDTVQKARITIVSSFSKVS